MSEHSIFAPSKAAMWIACPGSMSFPENRVRDEDGGPFAAEGTAAHTLAARTLNSPGRRDCSFYLGEQIQVGERVFVVTDEMAMYTQVYVDYVRDRAAQGHVLVEQRVNLTEHYGTEAGGTMDAGVAIPRELDIIDFKYGRGIRVYAEKNPQLMSYAIGGLDLLDMFGPFDKVNLVIVQPRLDHIDVWPTTVAELREFADEAYAAVQTAKAGIDGIEAPRLNPGEKQCQWCKVKATCSALADLVARDIGPEFAATAIEFAPAREINAELARKYSKLPLIQTWCKAVGDELKARVQAGQQIIGGDGQPFKIVQGKPGNAAWTDVTAVEAALVGQLPPEKAYVPRQLVTPAVAKKALGKKREKIWEDVLKPLTVRKDGAPQLAAGSDPREAWAPAAGADEFTTGEADGTAE
ncbi:MAG: DUF2800 domain-containing protein [Hyphomicrobiales bacterium]